MDLRALRYFIYVAEARSFSKAAVQLGIAQPALSRQVQKLENELGIELIRRTRRRLELTDAGLVLLERAHSLTRQVAQAADDVRAQGSLIRGSMTLGVSATICETLVPCIARESAARHPDLRLNFVEGFSGFIFKRLIDQELTLCLMHNPPRHQGIDVEPLFTEAMYLVGPPASSRLAPANAAMALDGVPLILPNRTHGLRMLIERAVAEQGGRLGEVVQVDGYTATKAFVGAGLGYTVLPYSSVRCEVEGGQFSAVRLRQPSLTWTLSIAYRKDQRTARAVAAVCDIVTSEVGKLARGAWKEPAASGRGQAAIKKRTAT